MPMATESMWYEKFASTRITIPMEVEMIKNLWGYTIDSIQVHNQVAKN